MTFGDPGTTMLFFIKMLIFASTSFSYVEFFLSEFLLRIL